MNKLNVLFEGWINIPHSYAIVLCFQLVSLYSKGTEINIFIKETKYFFDKWNHISSSFKNIYNKEYCDILEKIVDNSKNYKIQDIDIIYRIAFPYNISITNEDIHIPKCIFYTSEFSTIDYTYFTGYPTGNTEGTNTVGTDKTNMITKYLNKFQNLYFTGPSKWSINGLNKFNVSENRNRVITHGVDCSIFYKNISERFSYRKKFGIKDNEILLLNMGAFTTNKGILLLIQLINIIVNKFNMKNYKIVFKGLSDLYESEKMLNIYFEHLKDYITEQERNVLFSNGHIIFTSNTMSFDEMRMMYNMADLYISPYIAEGFNITPIESLACGTPILISKTGSTEDYINDIKNYMDNNCQDTSKYSNYISVIESKVITEPDALLGTKYMNEISFNSLIKQVIDFRPDNDIIDDSDRTAKDENYNKLTDYLKLNYSWDHVADLLINYFRDIKNT